MYILYMHAYIYTINMHINKKTDSHLFRPVYTHTQKHGHATRHVHISAYTYARAYTHTHHPLAHAARASAARRAWLRTNG